MNEEISDDEAMFWLDVNCMSFTIGNDRRHFQASFNVSLEDGLLEAAKIAMVKFRSTDDESPNLSRSQGG